MKLQKLLLHLPSFGQLQIQIAEPEGAAARKALCIALPGSTKEEINCWAAAAEALSDQPGLRVVLPDLHSNTATAPAAISSNDAVKLVTELADAFQAEAFNLMGRAWGGVVAFNTACSWPRRVSRLALVAPAISDAAFVRSLPASAAGGGPVLLMWARDDRVMPFRLAQSFVDGLGLRLRIAVGTGPDIMPQWGDVLRLYLQP